MRLSITLWLSLTSASAVPLRLPSFVPVPDGMDADIDLLGDRLDGIDSIPLDANGCPVILTDSLCTDPAFWDTPCGEIQLADPDSACQVPLRDAMIDYSSPLDQVFVHDPITGELVQIPLLDAEETVGWDGFDTTFSPIVLSTLFPSDGDDLALGLVQQWWDQNCSVQSCEEYAYESYLDYSSWEFTIAAPLGRADWRAVFESAYAADGIARRTLYSSDGDRLPPLDIDARRDINGLEGRRNAFVGFDAGDGPRSTNLSGFSATFGSWTPAALAPWVLELIDELPQAAEGPAPFFVDLDVITDIVEHCAMDDGDGQMVCNPGALSVTQEIATRFNGHLLPYDADQIAQIPDVGVWPPAGDPWDVHRTLADSLVGTPDETLLWLERRQEQFNRASQARNDAWSDLALAVSRRIAWNGCVNDPINDVARCIDTVPAAERATRALETLRKVDLELNALLDLGESNGCFGPAPTPCDWSPRWPALAFLGHYQTEREALYQTCITRTGNDFRLLRDSNPDDATPHWLVSQEQQRLADGDPGICASIPSELRQELSECAILDDYMVSPRSVTAYFDTVDAWVETLRDSIRLDPETGRPAIGESAGDRQSLGSSLFGADMVHDAGWLLTGLESGVCSTGGEVWGRFGAGARVLGLTVPPLGTLDLDADTIDPDAVRERRDPENQPASNLFFADLHARSGDDEAAAHVVLDLLGQNLFAEAEAITPDGAPGYTFHWSEPLSHTRSQEFVDGRTTFFVGPVPVNLAAGAAGAVGFDARASMHAEVCNADTVASLSSNVSFRPSVGAYGFADASAGISGLASVGVDSNLTLAEAALPLSVDATGLLDPNDETPDADVFTVTADLDLELTLLRGRVRVYVELLTSKLAKTLVRIPGITERLDLFDTGWTVDLAALASAIANLTNDADPSLPNDGQPADNASRLYEDRGVCIDPTRPAPNVYLNFDDVSVSGGALNATAGQATFPLAGATTSLEGLAGQSIEAGTAGLLSTPDSLFAIGAQRAWSLWFRADSHGGTILSRGTSSAPDLGMTLETLPNGRVRVGVACSGGSVRSLTSQPVAVGEWHHVMLSLGADALRMAVDDAYLTADGCILAISDLGVNLGVESRPDGVSDRFDGRIDELGYWSNLERPFTYVDAAELRQQGLEGRPLAGTGSAPLTGITDLSASLSGTSLTVGWTPPPSLADPGHGYSSVIVTVGTDAYIPWDGIGVDRYEGTNSAVSLTVGPADDVLKVATYGITTTGVVVGPRLDVQRPLVDLPNVTGLLASAAEDQVALSWRLPADPRIARVQVVRSMDAPPSSPESGVLVFDSRGEAALDVGLPSDTPVHYTLWTLDGVGRRSTGVSLSTATVSGVSLDLTPPAPVLALQGDVTASSVDLTWSMPTDVDPLEVEITRGLATLPGGVVFRGPGSRFIDDAVAASVPYTWTLRTVDPAGNRSTPVVFRATPAVVQGLALLDATADDTRIDLLHAPIDPVAAMETVIVRGDVSRPTEGAEICRQPSGQPLCTDPSPPAGPVVYTGFVYDGLGRRSFGLASAPVSLAPTSVLTAPADVQVGELVRLGVTGTVSSAQWTMLDGPRLLDATTEHPWFHAATPGTVRVRFDGIVDGVATTETLDLSVDAYTGATSGFMDNPFVDVLLPGHDRLHMAVDGDRIWATRRSFQVGDVIVAVNRDGSLHTSIGGTWAQMRHADGNRVLLADDFGAVELWLLDGTPAMLGSENNGHGVWRGDVKNEVLAYVAGNDILIRDVSTGLVDLGSITVPAIIDAVALSDDGDTLYVAYGSTLETYDLTGGTTPVNTLILPEDVAFLAVDNGQLATLTRAQSSTLRIYDLTDPLLPVSTSSAPAGELPSGLDLANGYALVQQREQAIAFTTAPLAPVGGLFAHANPFLTDAALVEQPTGVEVWLSSETFSDLPTTGIIRRDVDQPLPELTSARVEGVFASAVPAFANREEHWAAVDFAGLLHGDASTVVQTPYTPDFGFFDTLCVGDEDVLVVQDPGLVTRFDPLTGTELSTWTLPAGCDRLACSEDHVLMQCGTTWVAADRATGTTVDTTTAPATDLFAQPDGDQLVGIMGTTVVARTLVNGQWTTGLGDGLNLPGYPSFTPATVWQDALFAASFSGVERFDLTDGTQTTVSTSEATIDAGAGLAVSITDGRIQSRWLEQNGALVSQLPSPNDFDLTADGGHAFTLDGSSLGTFDTVTAFLHHDDPATTVLPVTLMWEGPDSQPLCQVTGGSCTIDSVQSGSATISWTLPTSGEHELSVAVGDVRWMATARTRVTVGGAP